MFYCLYFQGTSNSYQIPEIDKSFESLSSLSNEELESLLEDETKFMELFHSMPGLKKFFEERNNLYHTCQELASMYWQQFFTVKDMSHLLET